MLLIKNADVLAPEALGVRDMLLGGGRILHLEPDIQIPEKYCRVVDARGLLAVPGFIDGHVHMMGAAARAVSPAGPPA